MRITILTVGSRGDAEPLLGLGVGLASAGHKVRLATHPKFEAMAQAVGLDFAPLAEGKVSKGPSTVEGRRWLESGSRHWPAWVAFIQDARSVARQRLAQAIAACEDAEVILANELATLLGWQTSERFAVPLVRARMSPPGAFARNPAAAIVRQAAWLAARPWLRSLRRDAGLPALPAREPLGQLDGHRALQMYAYSPAVMPAPAGAGPRTRVTGYWFLDHALDPEPPAGLPEFLDAGPAPVCIGFGSMLAADPDAMTELAIEALRAAGQRGVLVRGPHGHSDVKLPQTVFAVEAIPYGWLFERCAAVVHHGGAGTTAATLRAGVPSVTVPHMMDQYTWARRLHELGACPPPIPRRRLSRQRLGEAIAAAVCDPRIGARAAALGERIGEEDGITCAVQAFGRDLGYVAEPSAAGVTNG